MSVLRRKLRRDMRARRGQFLAVVATIGLGLTLFALSYDAYRNLLASYQRMFDLTGFADFTVAGGETATIVRDGGALTDVATAVERRVADVPLRIDGHKVLGRVVGMPAGARPAVNDVLILDGSYLKPGDEDGVLVEKHAAEHFGLAPGATLEVYESDGWRALAMVGKASSAEYLWPARSRQEVLPSADDFAVVFAAEALLERLDPSAVHREVLFAYQPGSDRASVDAALTRVASANGATDFFPRADQPSNAALSEDIQGFGAMAVMFPALFLGAAGMATYVLLTRLVLAQRSQIGLMLANGFARRTVFGHYLGFGLTAGLLGTVPGLVAGMLLARWATRLYTDVISVPVRVVEFHAETAVIGVLFGVGVGALATLAPALRASRLQPAVAMRGATLGGRGGQSLLEWMMPPLRRLPARWKMVVRGIARSRRRSLSTALGVVFAAVLILTSWGMIDTTQVLLARQFDEVQRQDAQVYFAPGKARGTVGDVAGVEGVQAVEPAAEETTTVRSAAGSYQTSLIALERDTTMHGFSPVSGGPDGLPAAGVLLGAALEERLDIAPGDVVTVVLPGLGVSFEERVAGFVDEPLGTFAYVALPRLAEALGRAPGGIAQDGIANSLMVRFDAGADAAAVRDRLSAVGGVAAVVDSRALERAADQFMGLFYAFVGLMVALGAVMAFALIFTTMSANVSERVAELASLRAAGMGRRTLARLITGENMLLTMLGIVPGLLVGYLSARLFMATFTSDLFSFDLALRWTTPVFVAAALLGAALLSQWPVLRAVDRVDVAKVVRERSQ